MQSKYIYAIIPYGDVMNKAIKLIIPTIAIICVALIIYFIFFFSGSVPEAELTTKPLTNFSISFDSEEIEYKKGMNYMQGVTATGEDGENLTKDVTVSCKPTKDIHKKELTYSVNKAGYTIMSYTRTLVLDDEYQGPSIKINDGEFKIAIDKINYLTTEIQKSGIISTDDGFGESCGITASFSTEVTNIGDYVATVTAENSFGDTASTKLSVSVTEAESSIIKLNASAITLNIGDEFIPNEYVKSAISDEYGDLTSAVICTTEFDTSRAGIYTIEYRIQGLPELKNEIAYLHITVK